MSENAIKGKNFLIAIGLYFIIRQTFNGVVAVFNGAQYGKLINILIAVVAFFALRYCSECIKSVMVLLLSWESFSLFFNRMHYFFSTTPLDNIPYIPIWILDLICLLLLVRSAEISSYYAEKDSTKVAEITENVYTFLGESTIV
jgi:hypothetical protein